jgi:hypothetical protein
MMKVSVEPSALENYPSRMTGKSGVVFEEQQPTDKHEKHILENTSQTRAGQSGTRDDFLETLHSLLSQFFTDKSCYEKYVHIYIYIYIYIYI